MRLNLAVSCPSQTRAKSHEWRVGLIAALLADHVVIEAVRVELQEGEVVGDAEFGKAPLAVTFGKPAARVAVAGRNNTLGNSHFGR